MIELLVVIAVSGILLGAICSTLIFGMNLVNATQTKFSEHAAALATVNKIKSQVQNATSLTIYTDPSAPAAEPNTIYYGSTGHSVGVVIKSNNATPTVFMPGVLPGYSCTVKFSKSDRTVVCVTVTVTNSKGDAYTLSQTIPLSNMGTASGSKTDILDTTGGGKGTLIGFNLYQKPT